jgi:hypothetical protein
MVVALGTMDATSVLLEDFIDGNAVLGFQDPE